MITQDKTVLSLPRRILDWYNSLPGNLTNLVFFLLGILVTLLFAWANREFKEISLSFSDKAIVIFDSNVSVPALRLVDLSGRPIEGTVYIETVTIWNSGTQPLENSDVRSPIQFTISPISRLLYFGVVRSTFPEISNFQVIKSLKSDNSTAVIRLIWDHFDEGFGATVQVMYEGDRDADIVATGHIHGISPNRFRILGPNNPVPQSMLTWGFSGMSAIVTIIVARYYRQRYPDISRVRLVMEVVAWTVIIMLGVLALYEASSLYNTLMSRSPNEL